MITCTLKELGYPEDPPKKLLPWIHMELQWKNLDKTITFSYDNTIHIYEVSELRQKYCFEIPYGSRSQWIDPVSYTHLDVYKRQGYDSDWDPAQCRNTVRCSTHLRVS